MGDIRAAKASAYHCLDALRAEFHCSAHSLFHCAAECYTVFQLQSDIFSHKLCVQLRSFDFRMD